MPVVGDWNGDGRDTLGLWDDHSATFYLRNSNTPGPPDAQVRNGSPGDLLTIPDARHSLEAAEDSAVLLTVAVRG